MVTKSSPNSFFQTLWLSWLLDLETLDLSAFTLWPTLVYADGPKDYCDEAEIKKCIFFVFRVLVVQLNVIIAYAIYFVFIIHLLIVKLGLRNLLWQIEVCRPEKRKPAATVCYDDKQRRVFSSLVATTDAVCLQLTKTLKWSKMGRSKNRQMSDSVAEDSINRLLTESGERDRLRAKLNRQLEESGWRDQVKLQVKNLPI